MEFLYKIIGDIIYSIYQVIPDYGFSIIILTIIVKTFLLPFAIKQQKSMNDMQKIQPKLQEIREKYKNDMNKMNEETMKLYSEYKVNPLGGCLPMLVQLPIFIALYRVIMHPLKYILKFSQDSISGVQYATAYLTNIKPIDIKSEIQIVEKSKEIVSSLNSSNIVQGLNDKIHDLTNVELLIKSLNDFNIKTVNEVSELIKTTSNLSMDFLNFINLAQTPSAHFMSPVVIIPILVGASTYFSTKLMTNMNPSASTGNDMQNNMQNTMMNIMPIFLMIVTFTLPAGLGLYILVSNIYQMIQQYFLNKFIPKEVGTDK